MVLERNIVSKSLYTQSDIKQFRDKLVFAQNNIDPILNEPFKEAPVLDHDHVSQHCRGVLNRNVNAFEGLVLNAYKRCLCWLTDKPLPEILRGLANYLEQDYSSNPYHPSFMKHLKAKFNKLNAQQQNNVLIALGSTKGANPKNRKELFAKVVLDRNLGYNVIVETIEKEQQ